MLILITVPFQAGSQTTDSDKGQYTNLQLVSARGNLTVDARAETPTYVAYFHVPIANADQVPLWIEVNGYFLIDYRFVETTPDNILIAARMRSAPSANLTWQAWVMVDENRFADLPDQVPMSSLANLPDSVSCWLQATDTAQKDAPIVQDAAALIRASSSDLLALADSVCSYCKDIPFEVSGSFDAVSALNTGSSCTGHAHAATALCRALGIPARTKLVLISWYDYELDMHWSTDYYVPGYGWVRMEPTTGKNPCPVQDEIVIYSCDPADEFPRFFTNGIDGFWHTSNPELGVLNPNWRLAHRVDSVAYTRGLTAQVDQALALTREVFKLHTTYQGIILNSGQQAYFEAGRTQQAAALDCLRSGDLSGTIANLESALVSYQAVAAGPSHTIYAADFEDETAGWTHGGSEDEWELGTPSVLGPANAHSGTRCWATDLDDTYESPADAWLLSPPVDLTGSISAFLEFWVWNQVNEASLLHVIFDPLWLDITTDGSTFTPLCSEMGGENSYARALPVGGWAQMNLDLTPYAGNTVQFRFRFKSITSNPLAGAYIDDVRVYGRRAAAASVLGQSPGQADAVLAGLAASPNPFNPQTSIGFTLASPQRVSALVYDLQGRQLALLADRTMAAGPQTVTWDGKDAAGRDLPSGVYLLRITAGECSLMEKLALVR